MDDLTIPNFTALTRTENQFYRSEQLTEAWEWIRK
jgi:hypothetical protein